MSSLLKTLRSYPRTFWTANTLELFERWAYYGIFNLLALYLTNSKESGALGFSQAEKGLIMGIVNAILYFLPIVTGAIADRFGYKRILVVAFLILSSGYYLMGQFTGFTAVFLSFFYVAIGAALFKPVISATIAKTTHEKNSSVGFGIFYMIVNIGGLIGPLVASELRETSWNYIFLMSSLTVLLNLVIVLLFFREPEREQTTEPLLTGISKAFSSIFAVLKDLRFTTFLIIIVGAWTVYWQYFYTLPVFIEQWVDTRPLYNTLHEFWPFLAKVAGTSEGTILAEKIIAMDAFFIILFQVIISSFIAKIKPLRSMTAGIFINGAGLALALATRNPLFLLSFILVFSFGEMSYSPKILEYIGRIAPRNKEALYMGTQFVPIALGNFIGGFLSGPVYERMSDRFVMMREILPAGSAEGLSNEKLIETATSFLNTDETGLNNFLWETFNPQYFALLLFFLSITTVAALLFYDRYLDKKTIKP
jgi:dipeptide/tripeptide permease